MIEARETIQGESMANIGAACSMIFMLCWFNPFLGLYIDFTLIPR